LLDHLIHDQDFLEESLVNKLIQSHPGL
jgi:hypothetical protein